MKVDTSRKEDLMATAHSLLTKDDERSPEDAGETAMLHSRANLRALMARDPEATIHIESGAKTFFDPLQRWLDAHTGDSGEFAMKLRSSSILMEKNYLQLLCGKQVASQC